MKQTELRGCRTDLPVSRLEKVVRESLGEMGFDFNTADLFFEGPGSGLLLLLMHVSTLWKQTSEDEGVATINIAINYVQTALEGDVICTSRLERRNKTNAVLTSEVRHEDGRLLANAIGSFAIFEGRHRSRVGVPAPEES